MNIRNFVVSISIALSVAAGAEQTWFTPDAHRLSVPYYGTYQERLELGESLMTVMPELELFSDSDSHRLVLRGDAGSISNVKKILSLFSNFLEGSKL